MFNNCNLIIYGPNIRLGGGLVLLNQLIKLNKNKNTTWIISNLFKNLKLNAYFIDPGIFNRLKAEFLLKRKSDQNTKILCFNGIPPFFNNRSKIYIYLQNRLLIDNFDLTNFNLKIRIRLFIEKEILKFHWRNIECFFVQTKTMKLKLIKFSKKFNLKNKKIIIAPFSSDINVKKKITLKNQNSIKFIYPSNFQPHKNHTQLILAWSKFILLRKDVILYLTIKPNDLKTLCKKNKLNYIYLKRSIKCLSFISHQNILKRMYSSDVLIFPSLIESYGLPLIEAVKLKIGIIAPKLDYVKDICKPDITFNPYSYLSIEDAMVKFYETKKKSKFRLKKQEDFEKKYKFLMF